MKILKSKGFQLPGELTKFVAENNIAREDILSITGSAFGLAIFYYAEE
jgi:hypothetical protein